MGSLDELLLSGNLDQLPRATVPISSLLEAASPRQSGENVDHVRSIAESEEALPPIVVNRSTMRVIDGMHRLRAAKLRGEEEVAVQFFDGDDEISFVLAVRVNVVHGLPLSLIDRKAAAARIIRAYPQWSDRMIALVTGLSGKTVASVRECPAAERKQLDNRVGRDLRVRPLDASEGRKRAARLIADNPTKSLRAIARQAGISPETVRDVRKRLSRGESIEPCGKTKVSGIGGRLKSRSQPVGRENVDGWSTVQALQADPAFRSSESGRVLLRILAMYRVLEKHRHEIVEHIPGHCLPRAAQAAYHCARVWQDFGNRIEQRRRHTSPETA
jgi:ParB-like chromosome segregation protein Spo0J